MITALGHRIEPTRFPDGTTQVWKLPNEILNAEHVHVDWRFEREDEFFSVAQLRTLVSGKRFSVHVPYLPYARQDKEISNGQTFSLRTFSRLVNVLRCEYVSAVDVHNPDTTRQLIDRFQNVPVEDIHWEVIKKTEPDLVVFPDAGAQKRYSYLAKKPHLVFEKERNPATGEILGHVLSQEGSPGLLVDGKSLLIVDDICDGGATFLSIAKTVKAMHKSVKLDLFVTHGLFSKGRKILEDAGFTLHTTNSLPRNPEGIPV